MPGKILHLLENLNVYGGTPSKTIYLAENSVNEHSIYTWHKTLSKKELSYILGEVRGRGIVVHENYVGRNIFCHLERILKVVDNEGIDIIHAYFHFGEFLGFLIKKLRPRVKFVASFVGANAPKGLKRILFKAIYASVDEFVFISEYVKAHYSRMYPVMCDRGHIIYNGSFRENELCKNVNKGIERELLSIGGLIDIKNHKVILKALKILRDERQTVVKLSILGEGAQRNELQSYCEAHGLQSLVSFPGYKSDVVGYLSRSSIYLHPCLVEGFGIAVLEAMLAGKAIVCSNSGALPELIVNNESGLLVDVDCEYKWANAIEMLLNDDDLRLALGRGARQKAIKDFAIKNFVELHDELIYNDKLCL